MTKMSELSENELEAASGGTEDIIPITGGPIIKTCPKCGKEYMAGSHGVNHNLYPLKTMCVECSAKLNK